MRTVPTSLKEALVYSAHLDPDVSGANWLTTRQHQPNDDMQQPGLNFEVGATFARYMFLCGFMIANDPQKPSWNKGDFFAQHFAPEAE